MRKLHLTDASGRDATVDFRGLKPASRPRLGLPGHDVRFRRYLGTTNEGLHDSLVGRFGADYGAALIEGDPEVDLEQVGRQLGETMQVYLAADGEVLHAPPEVVEVILGPDGEERARRTPEDVEANVQDALPIRWTGRRIARADSVRRFVVSRTLQIRHVNGLTYDFLYAMAEDLDQSDEVVLVGAGPGGKKPLIFQLNGTPWRGFLEGRVRDAGEYMLLLHLSNMELRTPGDEDSEDAA
ncbi:MAG: hypothetical protein AAGC60_16000 [Acidobacteriota bacterium]